MSTRTYGNMRQGYPIGSLLPGGQPPNPPRPQAFRGDNSLLNADSYNRHVRQEDPWPEVGRVATGAVEASGRFFNWGCRATSSGGARTSSLWARPERSSKGLAVVLAVVGIALLCLFGYIVVCLLPIVILGAIIAAVAAAMKR